MKSNAASNLSKASESESSKSDSQKTSTEQPAAVAPAEEKTEKNEKVSEMVEDDVA